MAFREVLVQQKKIPQINTFSAITVFSNTRSCGIIKPTNRRREYDSKRLHKGTTKEAHAGAEEKATRPAQTGKKRLKMRRFLHYLLVVIRLELSLA